MKRGNQVKQLLDGSIGNVKYSLMTNGSNTRQYRQGRYYYTYKNRSLLHPNYTCNNSTSSYMNNNNSANYMNRNTNENNGTNFLSSQYNMKYDNNSSNNNNNNYFSSLKNNYPQHFSIPNINPNMNNPNMNNPNLNNPNMDPNSLENASYQYFSIFGSTAMCLIKPIFPDQVINKNRLLIFGKGGFQFMFMKRHNNSNRYDKNNKMSIFVKITNLSDILFLKNLENWKDPLTLKGTNNNYLIIDKHKEKKDHLILKYKYYPMNVNMHIHTIMEENSNTQDTTNNTIPFVDEKNSSTKTHTSTSTSTSMSMSTPNLTMDTHENTNEQNLNEESKKNAFKELHVSFPFSEFLLFQKAANLLLPQLLGWARQF